MKVGKMRLATIKKAVPAWGVEIGDHAVKVVKLALEVGSKPVVVVKDAFEYPINLSQPDVVATTVVPEALAIMRHRYPITSKDPIVLGIPTVNCLWRSFTLPPIDISKMFEVVGFEARQNIPFPLEEVVWTWAQVDDEETKEGFVIGAEIVLQAVKKDQLETRLALVSPLLPSDIQMNTTALFNALAFDAPFTGRGMVVAVGTMTTDVIVLDLLEDKVVPLFQRSIPLGGAHYTRQLAKELKLTFAKAEHLKRNVYDAEEATKLVELMNPVTMVLVLEIQRTLGFFRNVNRDVPLTHLLFAGPAVDADVFKTLKMLEGPIPNNGSPTTLVPQNGYLWDNSQQMVPNVSLWAPQYFPNSFAVPFGLALQGIGGSVLNLSLLPPKEPLFRMPNWKRWIPRFQWPLVFDRGT